MSKYVDYNNKDIYDKIYNARVLGVQTLEDKIEDMRGMNYKYVTKTIISGDILECEIYPIFEKGQQINNYLRKKPNKEIQDRLNKNNSIKKFVRLINTNFKKGDLMLTLSYKDKYLPNYKQAKRDMVNYIKRLRYYLRKNNLPELKYVYVLEYVDDVDQHKSKKVRIHHHIIINKMDRDIAEDLWGKGRTQAKRLQPDESGLEGMSRYLLKQPKGDQSWVPSRNLKKPTIFRSVSRLSRRRAEILAKEENEHKNLFEKLYKDKYIFNECKTFYNEVVGGFYLYSKLRKRE